MIKKKKWLVILYLFIVDVLTLGLIMLFSNSIQVYIRGIAIIDEVILLYQIFIVIFVVVLFSSNGLYPGYGLTGVEETEKVIKSISIIFASVGSVIILIKFELQVSGFIFVLSWILSMIFVPASRLVLRNRISLQEFYGENVIVIGENNETIIRTIIRCRRLGWVPVRTSADELFVKEINELNIGQVKEHLLTLKKMNQVELVVVSTSDTSPLVLSDEEMWIWLTGEFKRVSLVYTKNIARSVKPEPRDLEGVLGLEFSINLHKRGPKIIKRLIDIIISIFLLVILVPLMLFIALVIFIDSGFPIIYRHARVGKDFKDIELLKFRTMKNNSEEILSEYFEENLLARDEFEKYMKLSDDPRVTRVGNFLRRYSLDEIPQFINVLRGEMSLIGPRAVTAFEVENYGGFACMILRALPGISGWWQVMGRNSVEWDERVDMEVYYVSNWSIWLDYFIFLKTFWVIISGQGQ